MQASYSRLTEAGLQEPATAADFWTAAEPVLAAAEFIHQHCHWGILTPVRRSIKLHATDTVAGRTRLIPSLPVLDWPARGSIEVQDSLFGDYRLADLADIDADPDTGTYLYRDRLPATARVRVAGVLAGHGWLQDTDLTVPAVPAGAAAFRTAAAPDLAAGMMILAGETPCLVTLSSPDGTDCAAVPDFTPRTLERGAAIRRVHVPPDLAAAAAAVAKRVASLKAQPGAANTGNPFQPAPQAPQLLYGLTRTLNAYRRAPWA